ncbi:MAG TPA: sigma-70 family RNA polymerase sigma factor [Nitrosomonas sp.]|nr:sigma-70 family RNA polymerase sigma factor [Nitrosomonas sp.]
MSDIHINPDFSSQDDELACLLSKIAQGDEQALAIFYDRTSAYVYSLALRILNDSTLAEEITLDVYMQIWGQAGQYDQSRGKPMAWLAVLTRSRSIDRLRVGKNERTNCESLDNMNEQITTQGNPEAFSAHCDQYRIVQEALAALSLEQRQVIEMAYFRGLSQSEIANQTGMPLGTVKTRIRSGMTKLRNLLACSEKGYVL